MFKRMFLTAVLIVAAVCAIGWKYQHYLVNPWTRDGQVRAQVILITPRVTGSIVAMHVKDNSWVHAGDVLFQIDPRSYRASENKAKANLEQAKAQLKKAQDDAARGDALHQKNSGAVSDSALIKLHNSVEVAEAGVMVASAALEQVALNLEFTQVSAPADGFITNLTLREGSQVVANQPALALIDSNSFWVEAFFKETDIRAVTPGADTLVTLMAYPDLPLKGKVDSIGYGIAHNDGSTGVQLLPNVSPTFQWIRLAQRIPVKIKLNHLPDHVQLRVGTSASVVIESMPEH
ncbi:HlyD family secretion protein [Vibrio sp. CAU 1672]|uniref:HlyD family secretion protein n=1 Tax=Vibrio sp. CAU 1672 TaxID=3032594 RepID=UPI0023DAE928|nr:HlyD family secretion protein [Vibrio sp. CAU 1672]MDF2154556.1 HlyD family secretion protein [Vibrio sp. CAU 1672]